MYIAYNQFKGTSLFLSLSNLANLHVLLHTHSQYYMNMEKLRVAKTHMCTEIICSYIERNRRNPISQEDDGIIIIVVVVLVVDYHRPLPLKNKRVYKNIYKYKKMFCSFLCFDDGGGGCGRNNTLCTNLF